MKVLITLLTIASTLGCYAQDGKIVEIKAYQISEESLVKIRRSIVMTDSIAARVEYSTLIYLSDGLRVNGYIARPKRPGIYPCIIFNRGGNNSMGAIDDHQLVRYLGMVASWGYVVIGSQYRGNMGGEGSEEFGGKDVNDVLNLLPVLSKLKDADTSRIGMIGWSRGGMMNYITLTRTNRIKATVTCSGLTDAYELLRSRPDMHGSLKSMVPGYEKHKDSLPRERSAVYWPEKIFRSPLLILHGSADWRVTPVQAINLTEKLVRLNHPVRMVLFEGGQHNLEEHAKEVNRQTKDFLDYYVRDRKPLPNLEAHGN